MKYIFCLGLCLIDLVIFTQQYAMALHVQRAPEIVQRITRQATRYVNSGGQNYRPASQLNYSGTSLYHNKRTAPAGQHQQLSVSNQRVKGVGAYTFGGMASGRPAYGNTFAINSGGGGGISGGGSGSTVVKISPESQILHRNAAQELQQQQQQQQFLKSQLYQQQSKPQIYRQHY